MEEDVEKQQIRNAFLQQNSIEVNIPREINTNLTKTQNQYNKTIIETANP